MAVDYRNAHAIDSLMSDAELASFPCSYSTAEGMLARAHVGDEDTVLITGASGGVGSALIQLAKRRGARVVAMASPAKQAALAPFGPDALLPRAPEDLKSADIVGGAYFPTLIDVLDRGGRYTCSGAIAGPIVSLDLRTLYLRDLTFTGSTVIAPQVFRDLIAYIETEQVRPVLAATYPLSEFHAAQAAFLEKAQAGNIVVIP